MYDFTVIQKMQGFSFLVSIVAANQVTREHNYVVKVDFKDSGTTKNNGISIKMGKKDFSCSYRDEAVKTDLWADHLESKMLPFTLALSANHNLCWKIGNPDSYWAYELCFGDQVKQFARSDAASKFVLGKYTEQRVLVEGDLTKKEYEREDKGCTYGTTVSFGGRYCGSNNATEILMRADENEDLKTAVAELLARYETEEERKAAARKIVNDEFDVAHEERLRRKKEGSLGDEQVVGDDIERKVLDLLEKAKPTLRTEDILERSTGSNSEAVLMEVERVLAEDGFSDSRAQVEYLSKLSRNLQKKINDGDVSLKVMQFYSDGSDGREAIVKIECGLWRPSEALITEPEPLKYLIVVTSPTLCSRKRLFELVKEHYPPPKGLLDRESLESVATHNPLSKRKALVPNEWMEGYRNSPVVAKESFTEQLVLGVARHTKSLLNSVSSFFNGRTNVMRQESNPSKKESNLLNIEQHAHDKYLSSQYLTTFLEPYQGSCMNVTMGWWTYEYCYPQGLVQYHRDANDKEKLESAYSLGVGETWEDDVNNVNISIAKYQVNGGTAPLQLLVNPEYKNDAGYELLENREKEKKRKSSWIFFQSRMYHLAKSRVRLSTEMPMIGDTVESMLLDRWVGGTLMNFYDVNKMKKKSIVDKKQSTRVVVETSDSPEIDGGELAAYSTEKEEEHEVVDEGEEKGVKKAEPGKVRHYVVKHHLPRIDLPPTLEVVRKRPRVKVDLVEFPKAVVFAAGTDHPYLAHWRQTLDQVMGDGSKKRRKRTSKQKDNFVHDKTNDPQSKVFLEVLDKSVEESSVGRPLFALRQRLEDGTECDETKKPRRTDLYFVCPPDWSPETQPEFEQKNRTERFKHPSRMFTRTSSDKMRNFNLAKIFGSNGTSKVAGNKSKKWYDSQLAIEKNLSSAKRSENLNVGPKNYWDIGEVKAQLKNARHRFAFFKQYQKQNKCFENCEKEDVNREQIDDIVGKIREDSQYYLLKSRKNHENHKKNSDSHKKTVKFEDSTYEEVENASYYIDDFGNLVTMEDDGKEKKEKKDTHEWNGTRFEPRQPKYVNLSKLENKMTTQDDIFEQYIEPVLKAAKMRRTPEPQIVSVTESLHLCEYQVIISMPYLCAHPYMRYPVPKEDVEEIKCTIK